MKKNELKSITKIVKTILEQDELARNSDKYLYMKVIEKLNADALDYALVLFLTDPMFNDLPCFESVRRARQKVQQHFPELAGSKRVQAARKEDEAEVKEFARDKTPCEAC